MTNTFLKAKHWQLFIIIFAIPMLATMLVTNSMTAKIPEFVGGEIDPGLIKEQVLAATSSFMKAFGLIMTFTVLTLWGWYWSVGTKLQEKIPQDVKMNVKKFSFFYVIGFLYSLFFIGLIVFIAAYLPMIISGAVSSSALSWTVPIFGVIHFLAIFFFPIGVWILQPRINALVEKDFSSDETDWLDKY